MKKIVINLSNRAYFTLLLIVFVCLLGVGVMAYGTSNPAFFGHSSGEIEGFDTGFCIFSRTQTSCPFGWSRDTFFDGSIIYGGSQGIGEIGAGPSHQHTTPAVALTVAQMPSHNHDYYISSGTGGLSGVSSTGNAGGGQPHSHGDTGLSTTGWNYMKVLVCCKD